MPALRRSRRLTREEVKKAVASERRFVLCMKCRRRFETDEVSSYLCPRCCPRPKAKKE